MSEDIVADVEECLGSDPDGWTESRVKACAQDAAAAAGAAVCAEGGPIVAGVCAEIARELAGPLVDLAYDIANWFGPDEADERRRQAGSWDRWQLYEAAIAANNARATVELRSFVAAVNAPRGESVFPVERGLLLTGLGLPLGGTAPGAISVEHADVVPWPIPCTPGYYRRQADGRWVRHSAVDAGCVTSATGWLAQSRAIINEQADWFAAFRRVATRDLIVRTATLAAEQAALEAGTKPDLDRHGRLVRRPRLTAPGTRVGRDRGLGGQAPGCATLVIAGLLAVPQVILAVLSWAVLL